MTAFKVVRIYFVANIFATGSFVYNFTILGFSTEHDDRGEKFKPSEIKRRVSFKPNVRNNKAGNFEVRSYRAFIEDEDMIGELTQGEGSQRLSGDFRRGGSSFRGRRKGSPVPRNMAGGGKLMQSPAGWYLVTIQHGAKYEKDVILKLLLNAVAPNVFIPNYFKMDDSRNAIFYVEEHNIAEQILKLDRKLELPDGFKMMIRVRGSMPQTKIDQSLKERMKNAMVKRYNPATKALDLTKFHADPDLTDIFCALVRPPIICAAIDIISENIPDLKALNLNNNKLNLLEHLKSISAKLPSLEILYLGDNKVSPMHRPLTTSR